MTIEKKVPVWLDCDPGQDDTVAIIVACYCKYFDLVGISTVHGNVSLENTTRNALRVLTAISKTEVPVYPGEPKPLNNYNEVFAANVHGKTGLDGSCLLPIAQMQPQKHKDFHRHLAHNIIKYEGKLNIVATGPLTNIAVFFEEYPHLKNRINWISIMGGGFDVYNIGGNAEFNYYCDPFAARKVVEDEILSKRMIQASLDITSKVYLSKTVQERILQGKDFNSTSNFRAMMYEFIDSYNRRMIAQNVPDYKGPIIHDPVALVALLQFENITSKLNLSFDRRSFGIGVAEGSYGAIQSVRPDNKGGIYVLTDIDVEEFWDFVLKSYDEADKHAYMNSVPREKLIQEYAGLSVA
ncbi:unnamed protein product [Pichia kudriavzevii]